MKSSKKYALEDEFSKIEKLLDDTDLDKIIPKDYMAESQDDVVSGDDIPDIENISFPGSLTLRMDIIKMNLFLLLIAPVNSENEITIDDIRQRIESFGSYCLSKVDWEYINGIYMRIMFDGEIIPEIKIASGKPVKANVPEHIIVKKSLLIDRKPEVDKHGRVNYHKVKSFVYVKKGELLGDIIPDIPGVNGMNLLGKELLAPMSVVNNLHPGDNVFVSSGRIYAGINGTFKIINDIILVAPCLEIEHNIDYSTGDLKFDGDILIHQSIIEDFIVTATRDIIVDGSIEPTDVNCGRDLTIGQGVLGSEKHTITVGGDFNSVHVENAILKVKGNIFIENSSLKSSLYSLKKLISGDKCSIVGGLLFIQNGIVTHNIGNDFGVETKICLGVDFEIEDKLKSIQCITLKLVKEMTTLQEELHIISDRVEKDKMKYLFLTLKNRVNSLGNYSRSLLAKLDKNDKAILKVTGTIYPGSYIEICHVSRIIEKPLSRVEFFLDKEEGVVDYKFLL